MGKLLKRPKISWVFQQMKPVEEKFDQIELIEPKGPKPLFVRILSE